jgi:hypothetical protein
VSADGSLFVADTCFGSIRLSLVVRKLGDVTFGHAVTFAAKGQERVIEAIVSSSSASVEFGRVGPCHANSGFGRHTWGILLCHT